MSDNLSKTSPAVLCDMCTAMDRKPAQKTCMKCEISMCVQHLQTHLTTPVLLQTHPLTEPIASGEGGPAGTTKCPQHGKLLEYYCLDDLTCVCVSCAIEDQHRLHNMKTFSTAHKELQEKVTAELQALEMKTDGENISLEKWEKSEREKLGRSSVRLIQAVTDLHDLALTSVQSSVSARMVCLKTSKTSLLAAKTEEDPFRFLQMYSQVHQDLEKAKAVNLQKGLEPGSDCDKMVQEIRHRGEKMTKDMTHFWESLLTHVDPEEFSAATLDLFFKPQTLGQGVILSADKRKVHFCSYLEKNILLVQSIKSTTPYRWRISLSNSCDWTIGICDKNYAAQLNDGEIYGLCLRGNQLSSLMTEYEKVNADPVMHGLRLHSPGAKQGTRRVSLQVITPEEDTGKPTARPIKVEVVCSQPNLLSFYNLTSAHQRRKIVTITINSRNQCLTPFVCSEIDELLRSSPPGRSEAACALLRKKTYHHQQWQGRWKCSCGQVHLGNKQYTGSFGSFGVQHTNTCTCGKKVGESRIPEVLCELL
ncbi:E3 ubiquitin-protein ligase TRIM7-like [Halichoeres trimaculatus]|uniref:E3 ubiquitin-protein ligase TRIM7-like n=1 Tax=Halichoeres trimaculatus TaxID=147232 RepID=UPI003D9F8830